LKGSAALQMLAILTGIAVRLVAHSNRPFPALQRLSEQALVSSFISLAAFEQPGIPGRGVANPRTASGQRGGWRLARGAPGRSRC